MTHVQIVGLVLGTLVGIVVFAYLVTILFQLILFPWAILIHLISLGTIPMPEFETNPLKMLKDLFKRKP